jgi:hypothetical protein
MHFFRLQFQTPPRMDWLTTLLLFFIGWSTECVDHLDCGAHELCLRSSAAGNAEAHCVAMATFSTEDLARFFYFETRVPRRAAYLQRTSDLLEMNVDMDRVYWPAGDQTRIRKDVARWVAHHHASFSSHQNDGEAVAPAMCLDNVSRYCADDALCLFWLQSGRAHCHAIREMDLDALDGILNETSEEWELATVSGHPRFSEVAQWRVVRDRVRDWTARRKMVTK